LAVYVINEGRKYATFVDAGVISIMLSEADV
jgi:hypothetical protein